MAEQSQPSGIPTKEEIAQLPRWARVAFAARCARRVQPLFKHYRIDVSTIDLDAIDKAITLAEQASGDSVAARHARHAADAARHARDTRHERHDAAAFAAAAAHDAATAAAIAAGGAEGAEESTVAFVAATVADAAADAAARDAYGDNSDVDASIRFDFEVLQHCARDEDWDDDTPVPPDVFGPMWPDGPPEGWPALEDDDSSAAQRDLEFSVLIDPGDAEAEDIQEVFSALSDLHRACGGTGLEVVDGNVDIYTMSEELQ